MKPTPVLVAAICLGIAASSNAGIISANSASASFAGSNDTSPANMIDGILSAAAATYPTVVALTEANKTTLVSNSGYQFVGSPGGQFVGDFTNGQTVTFTFTDQTIGEILLWNYSQNSARGLDAITKVEVMTDGATWVDQGRTLTLLDAGTAGFKSQSLSLAGNITGVDGIRLTIGQAVTGSGETAGGFDEVAFSSSSGAPPPLTLTIRGNSFSGNGTGLIPLEGAPHTNETSDNTAVPPSYWRNFYYDSDGDLAFNSPGDTSGNTNESLALNKAISSAQVLNFYVDNDGIATIGANFTANAYRLTGLTMMRSDGSTVALDVTQGTPQTFTDPSGGNWQVALNGVGYLDGATTDIVGNVDSVPDGEGPDYHFTLTITYSAFSTFDDWAADFGIPNDAADDSDHDGIPALTEYGIGYNPTVSETLPVLVPSGADFTVTWPKGTAAAADPEISYVVEVSSELQVWGPPESGELVESGTELVLTLPAGQGKTFARLKVVRTP